MTGMRSFDCVAAHYVIGHSAQDDMALSITSVPHLLLTKIHKITQKNLASVEISRNLTNAN
jgi:hypothetical protein